MPAPAPQIRAATTSDLRAIAKIGVFVQRLHADAHPDRFVAPDVAVIESFFREEIKRDGAYVLVAEDLHGAVVGYAFAAVRDREDGAFLGARRTLSFEHLAVAEHALGSGAGGALIRAVGDLARRLEADDVDLVVWTFNQHAIDAYRHLGYRAIRQSMVLDL
jgi:ribosomal protein S18 acetylase RimI-like enzyme